MLTVTVMRTVVHYRTTGEVPIRLRHDRGSPEWWGWWLGTVAILLAWATPLAGFLGLEPVGVLDSDGVAMVGVVLAIIGVAGTVAGQVAMGQSWRFDTDPDVRTELTVTGPFRWVRNPIVVGMATTTVGLALVVPNVLAGAMVVSMILSLQIDVRLVEEPYLERTHGDAYVSYAIRTGRFVPGIGKRRQRPSTVQ